MDKPSLNKKHNIVRTDKILLKLFTLTNKNNHVFCFVSICCTKTDSIPFLGRTLTLWNKWFQYKANKAGVYGIKLLLSYLNAERFEPSTNLLLVTVSKLLEANCKLRLELTGCTGKLVRKYLSSRKLVCSYKCTYSGNFQCGNL